MAMIGEQFDYGEEICGAVVNVRNKQEKISLWTKNAANEAVQVKKSFVRLCLDSSAQSFVIIPVFVDKPRKEMEGGHGMERDHSFYSSCNFF